MTPDSLRYDPASGLHHDDATGHVYVFSNPECPIAIDVTGPEWAADYHGVHHHVTWDPVLLNLPGLMVEQARGVALTHIQQVTPGMLGRYRLSLTTLGELSTPHWSSFEGLTMADWDRMIPELTRDHFSVLRTLYERIAAVSRDPLFNARAEELRGRKYGGRGALLDDVISWNPTTGALTPTEQEWLYRSLRTRPRGESDKQHAVRVLTLLTLELGHRPVQLLGMEADALTVFEQDGIPQPMLQVPGAKAQRGEASQLYPITISVAEEIRLLSSRPRVAALQAQTNRLIVWDSRSLRIRGELSSADAKGAVGSLVKTLQIPSRIQGRCLRYTPRRGRHTLGVNLALDGHSLEEIAAVLGHRHPASAKAYLAAIGPDALRESAQPRRQLGQLFADLHDTFFQGKIASELGAKPIVVPPSVESGELSSTPLFVGSCGRDTLQHGSCPHHPFHACYSGCSDYVAWRDADHHVALAYTEAELQRWTNAHAHPERDQVLADLERLHQGITDVIQRIEEGRA